MEEASDSDFRAVMKVGGSEVYGENVMIIDKLEIYKMIFNV